MSDVKIVDINLNNISGFGLCGYKNVKQEGYKRKTDWLKKRFKEGMKVKILDSPQDGSVGMIEYVPGEYAWRPVQAKGYMFIHCLFVVFNRYKEKGYGSLLVKECLKDAKSQNMHGVAVVTRKGTWMAGNGLFLKLGFEVVDKAPPDFDLLAKKFKKGSASPRFKADWGKRLLKYAKGLTIICSDQCPYSAKFTREIVETAQKIFGIKPKVIELKSSKEAQNSPSPFGISALVLDGRLVADHPISNRRFINIMEKDLK
ncbi:MAG: GNAT family N-acetyltransferase [candidate division Zixibacteria bacterium]|nr:GNAT family N-acetyltransferase [candidate division Zixibacteria bacterium]